MKFLDKSKNREKIFVLALALLLSLIVFLPGIYSVSLESWNGTFFEGFESGNLTTNNWVTSGDGNPWYIDNSNPYEGTYHISVDPNGAESVIETNITTKGYKNIKFSFVYSTDKINDGEYIAADWYNGSDWVNVLYDGTTLNGNYVFVEYNLSNIADNNEVFRIRFRCLDAKEICYIDNVNVSGIDIPPIVELISPLNNSNTTNQTPAFKFNATDILDPLLNCSLYINNGNYGINSSVISGIETIMYPNSTLADGLYEWKINCSDSVSANESEIRKLRIDATPPSIIIDEPDVDGIVGWAVDLMTTISDSGVGVDSAWFNVINSSNDAVYEGFLNSSNSYDDTWITDNTTADGDYIFKVWANDSLGNIATKNVSFILDNTKPGVNIVHPEEEAVNESFNLDLRASNEHLTNTWYNITNSEGIQMQYNNASFDPPGYTQYIWEDFVNISDWADGEYNITFYAEDAVPNNRTISSIFWVDKSYPNITIIQPLAGSNYNLSDSFRVIANVSDNFNISSVYANISWKDGEELLEMTDDDEDGLYNSTFVDTTKIGIHNVSVIANDTAGNYQSAESYFYVNDLLAPSINLTTPENNSNFSSSTVSFKWIVSDNYNTNLTCNLSLDGIVNASNILSFNGVEKSYSISGINDGTHDWNISCWDESENINTSEERIFYVDTIAPNVDGFYLLGWINDSLNTTYLNRSNAKIIEKFYVYANISDVHEIDSKTLWFRTTNGSTKDSCNGFNSSIGTIGNAQDVNCYEWLSSKDNESTFTILGDTVAVSYTHLTLPTN